MSKGLIIVIQNRAIFGRPYDSTQGFSQKAQFIILIVIILFFYVVYRVRKLK